jgi:DnaJ-domain-containing protein 1
MDVPKAILELILDQPGTPRETLCRLFDLTDYRLSRVFRHIERDLAKRTLVHHKENGCWIIDIDASRCSGTEWLGLGSGGYVQCSRAPKFPDGCCYEHTQYENPEMVAFQRLLSCLVGPAEPTSHSLCQLSLHRVEELLTTLEQVAPASRKDEVTKRKLLAMMSAARAALRWRDEMRRRRTEERRIPPEFEERHRRSSINTYEYSIKKLFIVLEVSESASREDVLKAWRKMARRYHPDAEGGDEEMMKTINLAKEKIFRIRRWD